MIATPSIGDIVSFSYENYRNGIPVNPKIFRVRTDLSWENVVHNSNFEKPQLNGTKP